MFNQTPRNLRQINQQEGEDCLQLLTLEGDDFTQIKGLTKIAEALLLLKPELNLCISSNAHDFGTYYGLEVMNSSFQKYPEVESESVTVAEELGYEI